MYILILILKCFLIIKELKKSLECHASKRLSMDIFSSEKSRRVCDFAVMQSTKHTHARDFLTAESTPHERANARFGRKEGMGIIMEREEGR